MPQAILIDTSAWIEALRTGGDPKVRREVRSAIEDGSAAFCDMVLLELWNGARGDQEKRYLRDLERDLECLATTKQVWATSRSLAARCRRAGRTIPPTDLLIAACADHHGAKLLHRDGHFDQIREAGSETCGTRTDDGTADVSSD